MRAYVGLSGGDEAVYEPAGLAYYRHSDWLGSSRLASTPSRGIYYDGAYAPYGENYAESGTTDRSFTGQDQDMVSSGSYPLYDFLMREYHPTWGRWISPDPAGLAAANPANPQTWNRYAYVGNNPLSFTDPLGLWRWTLGNCTYDTASFYVNGQYKGDDTELVGCTSAFDFSYVNPVLPNVQAGAGAGGGGVGMPPKPAPKPGNPQTLPQTPGRVTKVARCAANLANTMSVAHYAHLQNTAVASGILSNDFSSLTGLIFGPGRGASAGGLAENLGTSPALRLTAKGTSAVPVDSGFQFLFSSIPATTFAETAVGRVAVKALGAVAAALSFESVGQAIYDAGVYAGAVYVCAQ